MLHWQYGSSQRTPGRLHFGAAIFADRCGKRHGPGVAVMVAAGSVCERCLGSYGGSEGSVIRLTMLLRMTALRCGTVVLRQVYFCGDGYLRDGSGGTVYYCSGQSPAGL